jgi:GNAT superfamily N-acetyltransferase
VNIRAATLEDLPTLVAMGEAMHAESPRYSRLQFSSDKVEKALAAMIKSPMALVLVAVDGDDVVGVILGFISAEWFSEELVAQEMAIYVVPEYRGGLAGARLIMGLDAWAEAMRSRYLQGGATTGLDAERTVGLYERLGFQRVAIGFERAYN